MSKFERLGVMLDCSRNGVLTVDNIKKYVDYIKQFGYNTLMLYTEDTYEVEGEQKFGYLRGKYSIEEIIEVDRYCVQNGIELIPCIQTLAHLATLIRWPKYWEISDIDDILLVGDDRTYNLIDNMFRAISKCFSSKTIHIGLDEASNLGRGKYLNKNGLKPRAEIYLEHLNKVVDIANKYNFNVVCWGDMLFSLNDMNDYYRPDTVKSFKYADRVPANLSLIYWDYYHTDKNVYDKMIDAHRIIKDDVWVASGAWTWNSYAPFTKASFKVIEPCIKSCIEKGVKNLIITEWLDRGECSLFSGLASLCYASSLANGISDLEVIKQKFFDVVGVSFDRFIELDLPNEVSTGELFDNPARYMLYNDIFLGIFDKTVTANDSKPYLEYAKTLLPKESDKNFAYLFETLSNLCEVLYYKYELGVKTRLAYKQNDKKALADLINNDYSNLSVALDKFYNSVRAQWLKENKGYGLEVVDIKLGAVMLRVKDCKQRLADFVSGKINVIEELEEDIQDYKVFGREMQGKKTNYSMWRHTVTPNVL